MNKPCAGACEVFIKAACLWYDTNGFPNDGFTAHHIAAYHEVPVLKDTIFRRILLIITIALVITTAGVGDLNP